MRIELRVEQDEHEYAVTLEADQRTSREAAIAVASKAMQGLVDAVVRPF